MSEYIYTKAVNIPRLESEISASAIVTALDYCILNGSDDLHIFFKAELSGGDQIILNGIVSAHINTPLDDGPQQVAIASQPDPSPFAQPTHRTKRDKTSTLISVAKGGSENIDFQLTEERYVSGGEIIVKDAMFGDWVTAEVYDKDAVIPEPYRAALCESWPTVAKYIVGEWVPIGNGPMSRHLINTRPLTAKITAGLYLRVTYNAIDEGYTRMVGVNYDLTKKL